MELKTLGRNIRRARQSRGLTQENAANDLGCSLNTYTKIERGETNVPFLRLVQIAEYLDISVSELTRESSDVDMKGMAADVNFIKQELQAIRNMIER